MENEILVGIVIAIVSAAIGWAISQATVGRKVAAAISKMELSIERCANDTHRAQDDIQQLRRETTERIVGMASLIEKVLGTADKLIDLVRIQNALLIEEAHRQHIL